MTKEIIVLGRARFAQNMFGCTSAQKGRKVAVSQLAWPGRAARNAARQSRICEIMRKKRKVLGQRERAAIVESKRVGS
jgi:hypothetical protein